jgi:hypothetical protein
MNLWSCTDAKLADAYLFHLSKRAKPVRIRQTPGYISKIGGN